MSPELFSIISLRFQLYIGPFQPIREGRNSSADLLPKSRAPSSNSQGRLATLESHTLALIVSHKLMLSDNITDQISSSIELSNTLSLCMMSTSTVMDVTPPPESSGWGDSFTRLRERCTSRKIRGILHSAPTPWKDIDRVPKFTEKPAVQQSVTNVLQEVLQTLRS